MRKLLLIATFVVCSLATMAQVTFFEGSLKEAIAKAKSENKTVIAMGSTTWCGPCKSIVANVLPTKEAADYFNPSYIYIKYNLDLADPDKIAETYKIKAYPTFLFINGEGEEITRMLGGAKDAEAFINRVKEVMKPENSFKARAERLKNDPSYATTYIKFLEDCYMTDEADKMYNELFEKRSLAENFTAENMKDIDKKINSVESPIFKKMISNEKEIKKIMGKESYNSFMQNKGAAFLMNQILSRKLNIDNLNKVIADIEATKQLQSNFTKFVISNKQSFVDKDHDALVAIAKKVIVKADSRSREQIVKLTTMMVPRSDEASKQTILSLFEAALKLEKNPEFKKKYENIIDGVKNPKGIPAKRMV